VLCEKVKYESLDDSERKLAEFTMISEKDCGYLFARRASSLRVTMQNLKAGSIALKLIHFCDKQFDGFHKH